MNKFKTYIIGAFMLLGCSIGYSQDTIIKLDDYLVLAANNNPKLKAAYSQYLAALEKVPQVGSLPDPQASFGFFIKPMELMGGNQLGNIQVMQMFPWFGTLKSAKDEASMMAKAQFEAFKATKAELFFQVKANWYQLMRYDKEIELVRDNVGLLESLEKLALVKFQAPTTDVTSSGMQGSGSITNSTDGKMSNTGNSMGNMNSSQNTTNASSAGGSSSTGMTTGMGSKQIGLKRIIWLH